MNQVSKSNRSRPLLQSLIQLLHLDTMPEAARRFLAFLFLNVLSWQCLIGTVMVLHARAIGIGAGAVGLLFSLLYFAGVLGVVTKPLAERFGSKRVLMTGWTARNLLVLPIVFTPVVFRYWGKGAAAALLFTTLSLFCITRALAGIAWSSWLHEIVPPLKLGRFYTYETVMTRLLTVVFGVIAFFVLGHNPPLWRFAVIAAFGVAFGLVSLQLLRRVPGGEPVTDSKHKPVRGGYLLVFRDRMFMGFLLCSTLFGIIYTGLSLLVTLTLRDQLGIGAGTILLLTSCGNVLAMFTTPRWQRIADRHGSPMVMAANGVLIVFSLLVLGWLREDRAPMALVALACALIPIAESGNYMATSRGYMLRMKPRIRHAYNAVWSALNQVFYGISAVFIGIWLQEGSPARFRSAAWGYALLMVIAIWLALRLPVPRLDSPRGPSPVYNPAQPLRSLGRMLRYVLRPARSLTRLPPDLDQL